MIRVTKIELMSVKPQKGLVAFASIVLNDCFYLASIAVHKKLDGSGFRMTYPTKKVGTKSLVLFHPLTQELSKLIEDLVFKKCKDIGL